MENIMKVMNVSLNSFMNNNFGGKFDSIRVSNPDFTLPDIPKQHEVNRILTVNMWDDDSKIDNEILDEIIRFISETNNDLIVHCQAGLNRSGAIAQIASIMGFDHINKQITGNASIKSQLIKRLYYDKVS